MGTDDKSYSEGITDLLDIQYVSPFPIFIVRYWRQLDKFLS